ncbi:hypothetical protein [Arenibacter sp. S6351L]|uniref:hypothetical protein n=1 Tax=Arenibacter sp. S6351L TaxID=2926407 RepID=UPI001FF1D461|nr:hypothetical protein [Arenibacter sp. S6351L]MCK0137369.1 hypothetical protein [Arenibacter sp. S6351L]
MSDKKIYRYTNVELLDVIKNGQSESLKEIANAELDKRNLTKKQLKNTESEYIKYQEFKEKRKDEPLTREEWISFFFLPFFTPRPKWRNDHFSQSEYQRFEKYGFDKKAKQASEVKILGFLFWFVIIIIGLVISKYLNF